MIPQKQIKFKLERTPEKITPHTGLAPWNRKLFHRAGLICRVFEEVRDKIPDRNSHARAWFKQGLPGLAIHTACATCAPWRWQTCRRFKADKRRCRAKRGNRT